MIYQKSSKHSQEEVEQRLRAAAQGHKFGILHVLDLTGTLREKGIALEDEVRIYDVCNPQAARHAVGLDLAVATVLPCRIAVWSSAEGTTIGTVRPTDLFAATGLEHKDTLAQEIEREMVAMIDEAAG